jgi:predicted secreted protein
MGIFGLIVVYVIVWWIVFFATLPIGVRHDRANREGHDPGAPDRPMLWRKAAAATVIAAVLVGGAYVADQQGWIDFRGLIYGER